MKRLSFWLVLLVPALLHAQHSAQQKFISGGTIRLHREKYGEKGVKKYYSKFDVAVVVQLT